MGIKSFKNMALLGLHFFLVSSLSASDDFNHFELVGNYEDASSIGNISLDSQSNLYNQIQKEFNQTYESIGLKEARKVLGQSDLDLKLGLGSIGFSYSRPFLNFNVTLDRNLAPDLFSDTRYIVTDTMTVDIDASKFLGNLKDEGVIDISKENLAAFVGVVFKRKYTWIHFSDNYKEGLVSDFSKLFFPFKAFGFQDLKKINHNEILFKEDLISFKGGGLISAPLYEGLSASAGILSKYERLARLEVIGLDEKTIQLTSEKSKLISVGANIGIQADFLNLLKITLLNFDFSYNLDSSYKAYLNFDSEYLKELEESSDVAVEIKQLLKTREFDLETLAPFLISEEKKITQTYNYKYNIFLLGKQKSSKTQQIEIATKESVKNYFRHYYEKIKYTESLLSKLYLSLINVVWHVDTSALELASENQKLTIEYESERNLIDQKEDLDIAGTLDDGSKISLSFKSTFKTQKTVGSFSQKYKDRASFLLENYTGVDPLAIDMLERDYLVAPLAIEGKFLVGIEGIKYFNDLSVSDVFSNVESVCEDVPQNKFFNFRSKNSYCKLSLQNKYVKYIKDLSHNKVTVADIDYCHDKARKYFLFPNKKRIYIKQCLSKINLKDKKDWTQLPLWAFKNFNDSLVNHSYNKVYFYNLFGVKNVFFYGTFNSMTKDEKKFSTSFNQGEFKALGAVDSFMRSQSMRAPASVVID